MSDEQSWSAVEKWKACSPAFRWKLDRVCDDLRALGWDPHMVYTWRSPETQAKLKASGRSKVSFSFHNVTQDGRPASLACDLIDKRHGWEGADAEAFFSALGSVAESHGLVWGGNWKFRDAAHIQMLPNNALSALRKACA